MVLADDFFSAWASVLAHINSTQSRFTFTMCSTAFPPPPPTPITLITALVFSASTSSNMFYTSRIRSYFYIPDSKIPLKPAFHSFQDMPYTLLHVHCFCCIVHMLVPE